MEEEQDNKDYCSRGWQLHKLQGVKLQDSQQSDKLLKKLYFWIKKKTKKRPEPKQLKNGVCVYFGSVYKSLSQRRDFESRTPCRTYL